MPHEGPSRDEELAREEPEPLQEEPRGSDEFGVTAEEQRRGEPLDERLEREEPEGRGSAPREADQLVDERTNAPDVAPELVADEAGETDRSRPAEEEAMRVEEGEAPGGVDRPSDGYVNE
ncbi:MAG TPA: hypothetical protein VE646_12945 [Actinomycetota bacterium]|nr:hypothetical protein [Actinomycetota bacterium]